MDAHGQVVAHAPGTATITATAGDASASAVIVVAAATAGPPTVSSVEVAPALDTLSGGDTVTLAAVAAPGWRGPTPRASRRSGP